MSKQITAAELAQVVTRLLTNPDGTGELSEFAAYQGFMTDIAQLVCDHCGGEIHHPADVLDDIWYVGIHGNESLPESGGVWRDFDKEGELFSETSKVALAADGVTDDCNQVCGGENCASDSVCLYGIDPETHLPPH